MNDHHLILGKINDVITGKDIIETHDEQFRQTIARILMDPLGYEKQDIVPKFKKKIEIDQKGAVVTIDFIVRFSGKTHMIIKYGPGSLVTRHRMTLALSRIIEPYQIPVVVVTNGKDADILDGKTGKARSSGLLNIPSKPDIVRDFEKKASLPISALQAEMESRIVYAFEIDDKCPCDDTHQCL